MEDGFFELTTAKDLFYKLKWEYERLLANPQDNGIAFNFFITAEHLPDWLKSKGLKNQPIPKICNHLANNAKHFHAKPKHIAVHRAFKDRYVEKGYIEEGYFLDPLIIEIDEELAKLANIESSIEVIHLAEKVINYWEVKFADSVW